MIYEFGRYTVEIYGRDDAIPSFRWFRVPTVPWYRSWSQLGIVCFIAIIAAKFFSRGIVYRPEWMLFATIALIWFFAGCLVRYMNPVALRVVGGVLLLVAVACFIHSVRVTSRAATRHAFAMWELKRLYGSSPQLKEMHFWDGWYVDPILGPFVPSLRSPDMLATFRAEISSMPVAILREIPFMQVEVIHEADRDYSAQLRAIGNSSTRINILSHGEPIHPNVAEVAMQAKASFSLDLVNSIPESISEYLRNNQVNGDCITSFVKLHSISKDQFRNIPETLPAIQNRITLDVFDTELNSELIRKLGSFVQINHFITVNGNADEKILQSIVDTNCHIYSLGFIDELGENEVALLSKSSGVYHVFAKSIKNDASLLWMTSRSFPALYVEVLDISTMEAMMACPLRLVSSPLRIRVSKSNAGPDQRKQFQMQMKSLGVHVEFQVE